MPAPVSAERATPRAFEWPRASPGSRSILFMMRICGISAAPISASTLSTCAVCSGAEGDEASTTCSTRAASVTSSRVARNAFTRVVGRLRMNPTVSLTSTRRREGSTSGRTVGSSVANIRASTATPAWVSRLKSVDLPALV